MTRADLWALVGTVAEVANVAILFVAVAIFWGDVMRTTRMLAALSALDAIDIATAAAGVAIAAVCAFLGFLVSLLLGC